MPAAFDDTDPQGPSPADAPASSDHHSRNHVDSFVATAGDTGAAAGAHAHRQQRRRSLRRASQQPAHGSGATRTVEMDAETAAAYHEEILTSTPVVVAAPRHRIEKRAPILWTIEGIWSWLVMIALQVGWYYYGDNVMAFWNWAALFATVPLAVMQIVVAPWWRYVVARWDVSDSAICSRTGWWTTQLRIAPLSRLQTVYTTRNLFERWFGLATVHASTASAHGSVQIRGLNTDDAETLAEHLLAIAHLDEGDAT